MKPMAKVPRASSTPTAGSLAGKNTLGKTSAAATPYRKKSYHSTVVPAMLADTTLTIVERLGGLVAVGEFVIDPPRGGQRCVGSGHRQEGRGVVGRLATLRRAGSEVSGWTPHAYRIRGVRMPRTIRV